MQKQKSTQRQRNANTTLRTQNFQFQIHRNTKKKFNVEHQEIQLNFILFFPLKFILYQKVQNRMDIGLTFEKFQKKLKKIVDINSLT